jgi:hypothetical protein
LYQQNIQAMRPILLLITLCYCAVQSLQAQNQPIQSPRLVVQPKVRAVDLSLKPELNFNGEPQQLYRSPQQRVVLLTVRNTGPVATGNFSVEVVYNWRVDHESFSAQSLKKTQNISALAAGQQVQVEFVVPDNLIHRNAPYGSANVTLSFKVDATGVVAEMSENNNTASLSLPILN